MKLLNGSELAGYIKERHAKQVRSLRQASGITPKLAIVVTIDHPAIELYMRFKQKYGVDILVDVDIHRVDQTEVRGLVNMLSKDESVHGIIIQLPLQNPLETDQIVDLVPPAKDVDALGKNAIYDPATPLAIMWLLAGYNISLAGKDIVLVGHGKLVGEPLESLLKKSDIDCRVLDTKTRDMKRELLNADLIITATGSAGLIRSAMIKQGAVVVDAGVASEHGKKVGDLAEDVYDRDDLTITPKIGGVGPVTIAALFDNLLRAAKLAASRTRENRSI